MKKYLNLPNVLTVLRVLLVPLCMCFILYPPDSGLWRAIAAGVFILISFTDMLDGKIARKYNLVTDFGKFLDPLADKFLILGVLLAMLLRYADTLGGMLVWVTLAVILRELAVTSLRLVAVGRSGKVIAASIWGKLKTVSQMVTVCVILLEPVIVTPLLKTPELLFSYIFLGIITVTTIGSGIDYFAKYLKK